MKKLNLKNKKTVHGIILIAALLGLLIKRHLSFLTSPSILPL